MEDDDSLGYLFYQWELEQQQELEESNHGFTSKETESD